MTDEAAFLTHLGEHPDDDNARLAFADWLDDHDRPGQACEHRLAAQMNAIRAHPDDDSPRLRYADVCEQYGLRDRAEFIRVQVELATRNPNPVLPSNQRELDELRRRMWELMISAVAVEWRRLPWGAAPREAFCRGFLESIDCRCEAWEKHGDAVCAAQPVRAVRFIGPHPGCRADRKHYRADRLADKYTVAGKDVVVDGRSLALAGSEENVRRLILSARWPQIPPAGWTFTASTISRNTGNYAGPMWVNSASPA